MDKIPSSRPAVLIDIYRLTELSTGAGGQGSIGVSESGHELRIVRQRKTPEGT